MPENEPENQNDNAAPETVGPDAAVDEAQVPQAPVTQRRPLPAWATSRTALAATAAVGVFLVGGLSGFAIGHTTGDDDRGDRFGPVSFQDGPEGDVGRPDGRFHGGPGQLQPPGQEQAPDSRSNSDVPGTDS